MEKRKAEQTSVEESNSEKKRSLPLWKKLLFSAALLFFLLIGLEIICRFFPMPLNTENKPTGPEDMLRFSTNSRIGWELVPDNPDRDHNADGFRGPKRTLSKPADTVRIAVLGDSITYGLGVDYDQTYSAELERMLLEQGESVEVLNFGVPGFNSYQELAILGDRVWQFDPDLVIMTFSTDDVETTPLVIQVGDQPILFRNQYESNFWFDSRPHWWLVGHSELYRRIYRGIVLLTTGMPEENFYNVHVNPETSFSNIESVARECNKRDVAFLTVISPLLPPIDPDDGINEYTPALDRVRTMLAKAKIPVVDLKMVYERYPNGELRVIPADCEHPNALGHAEAALAMFETVEKLTRGKSSD